MKQRVLYVDMIKGTAIMAVVLLHIQFVFPSSFFSLNSMLGGLWHVAIFFVVSGWFLKDERMLDFKSFAWGKTKGLYLKAMWIYIPLVLLHNLFFKWGWLFDDIVYNQRTLQPFTGITDTVKHLLMQFFFTHREPFSGAMWFVDSLFLALICFSIITIAINKIFKVCENSSYGYNKVRALRLIVCLILASLSIYLSKHGINIPKVSNTCSGMLLMCIGQMISQRRLDFDNKYMFVIALLVALHYNSLCIGMALNSNSYPDIVTLIVAPTSVLYVLAFIFKKIENSIFGKVINYVGKESFWVMGLHMVGFHVFTSLLVACGYTFEHHFTTPELGNNVVLLLGYFVFGCSVPLVIKETITRTYRIIRRRND